LTIADNLFRYNKLQKKTQKNPYKIRLKFIGSGLWAMLEPQFGRV
jgi:hypothetical protein